MCLQGYIGISSALGTSPSGLYLTQLPGITLDNIEKIAGQSADQPDMQGVFADIETRALRSLNSAFAARMCAQWGVNDAQLIDCLIGENKDKLAPALWYALGAEYAIERQGSDRLNRYTTIDRKRAADMQQLFESRYDNELNNAVQSIDPNAGQCAAGLQPKQLVTFTEPVL